MGVGLEDKSRSKSRRGSELVEGMLIMLPFLALVFLIIDTAYGLFLNATIQYAVQAGANYAATDTANGLEAGIQSTVQAQSYNLIQPGNIVINFYAPTSMTTPLNSSGGTVLNQAGNVVQIAVNYTFTPLAPLFRSGVAIPLSATAATVLAANPPPSL